MSILGIIASSKLTAVVGDFESIATVTVGSGGAADVEFTSIPATYTHLQIRGIGRSTASGNYRQGVSMRVNSDSGSNYSFHRLWGTGAIVAAGGLASQTLMNQVAFVTDSSGLANSFGTTVIDILDYANTNKYKTLRSLTGFDNNTTGGAGEQGGVLFLSDAWYDTSAITSISLFPESSGNFAEYSTYALYGIKAA